jgi:hypothetical protein
LSKIAVYYIMLLLRWFLPLAAGALAGWLAVPRHAGAESAEAGHGGKNRGRTRSANAAAPPDSSQKGVSPDSRGTLAETLAGDELAFAEKWIARVVAVSEGETLQSLSREIAKMPPSAARSLIEEALFQRAAETDPAPIMTSLHSADVWVQSRLFPMWLRTDTPAAIRWALAHPKLNNHGGWAQSLDLPPAELRSLAEKLLQDPAFAKGISGSGLLQRIGAADAAEAQRLFAGIAPDHPQRRELAEAMALGMSKNDASAALAWLQAQTFPDKSKAWRNVLSNLAVQQPEQVPALLEQAQLSASDAGYVRGCLTKSVVLKGPDALQAHLQSLPDGAASAAYSLRIPAKDLTLAQMAGLSTELQRTGAGINESTWDWSGRDVRRDLSAAATLPDTPARTALVGQLAPLAASSGGGPPDVQEMRQWPDAVRETAVTSMIRVAAAAGDVEAARLLGPLLAPGTAADIIAGLVEKLGWASYSPLCADVARELYPLLPAEKRNAGAAQITRLLANADFAAGERWVSTLPPDEQADSYFSLASRAVMDDEVAGSKWIQSLPAGPARDSAISILADHVSGSDPEAALAWALSVGGAEKHREVLTRLAAGRLDTFGPSAVESLRAAEMPAADRAIVEEAIRIAEKKWSEGAR